MLAKWLGIPADLISIPVKSRSARLRACSRAHITASGITHVVQHGTSSYSARNDAGGGGGEGWRPQISSPGNIQPWQQSLSQDMIRHQV